MQLASRQTQSLKAIYFPV